jgi:hypothetical protein
MTLGGSLVIAPGLGLDGFGLAGDLSSDGVHYGSENVRRIIPDIGGDLVFHLYPPGAVSPAMLRESVDWALDIGNFEVLVTVHPKHGFVGFGGGIGKDLNLTLVDVTWASSDLRYKP